MKTYKLCRIKNGKLYPMYVESARELPVGEVLQASCGEVVEDGKHVKSRLGNLSLRPGFHSTIFPFAGWIGRKCPDGKLRQKIDTVWCECTVIGNEMSVTERNGLRTVPNGWYRFRTNPKQIDPWIISGQIRIDRILTHDEVVRICAEHGIVAQEMEVAS